MKTKKSFTLKLLSVILTIALLFGVIPSISTPISVVQAAAGDNRYQIVSCDYKDTSQGTDFNYPRQDLRYCEDGRLTNDGSAAIGKRVHDYSANNQGELHLADLWTEGVAGFTFRGKSTGSNNNKIIAVDFYNKSYDNFTSGGIADYQYISFDFYCSQTLDAYNILEFYMEGFTQTPQAQGNGNESHVAGESDHGKLFYHSSNTETDPRDERGFTLSAGWNRLVMRITASGDWTTKPLKSMRLLFNYNSITFENVVFAIDDVCLLKQDGLEDHHLRNDGKDLIHAYRLRMRGGGDQHYGMDTSANFNENAYKKDMLPSSYANLVSNMEKLYCLPTDVFDYVAEQIYLYTDDSNHYGRWAKWCYQYYQNLHNKSFHNMNANNSDVHSTSGTLTQNLAAASLNNAYGCVEGTASQKFTVTGIAEKGNLYFRVKGNEIDLSDFSDSQLYLIFDLYVDDATKLETFQNGLSDFGDMRICLSDSNNINSNMTGITNVAKEQVVLAYSKLKQGWNQVAVPFTKTTGVVKGIQFNFCDNAHVMNGMTIAFDDVRICDQTFMADPNGYTDWANAKMLIDYVNRDEASFQQGPGYSYYETLRQINPLYREFWVNNDLMKTTNQKIVERRAEYNQPTNANDDHYSMEFCHIKDMENCVDTYSDTANKATANTTNYSQGEKGFTLKDGSHTFYGNSFSDGKSVARGYQRTTDLTPWMTSDGKIFIAFDFYVENHETLTYLRLFLGSTSVWGATPNVAVNDPNIQEVLVINLEAGQGNLPTKSGWNTAIIEFNESHFDNNYVDMSKIWTVRFEVDTTDDSGVVVDDVRALQPLTRNASDYDASSDFYHGKVVSTIGAINAIDNEYDVVDYKVAEEQYAQLSDYQLMQVVNRGDLITMRAIMQYAQVEITFGSFIYDWKDAVWDTETHTYHLVPQENQGNKLTLKNTSGNAAMQVFADVTAPKELSTNWYTLDTTFTASNNREAANEATDNGSDWLIHTQLNHQTVVSYYLWLDGNLVKNNMSAAGTQHPAGNIAVTIRQDAP